MMHYRKGENIEKQLTKEELPFQDFLNKDTEFLWMHVNGGTKVNNVLSYAKNALDKGEYKNIVWSGNGGGVVKTISCAEILKRSYPLYQVSRMCYTTVEEHWKPQMEGLEEIVANRQIPSLHIFMSLEPVGDNVKGLQKPNTKTDFWVYNNDSSSAAGSSSNYHRGMSQNQRRPKPNQNRNPQHHHDRNHQPNSTNASGNQEPSNVANSTLSGNQQKKFNNNQKRKRPNVDRDTQNPPRRNDNSNQESN